nr:MAG TPA: NTP-PPase-like protein [Caudoviricetes sp.]
MEALKKFDIEELLKRQGILDKKFDEKETARKRTIKGIQVALITEIGELAQELKNEWNYWKNSTEKFNKSKVLGELSDVLHFYLSYINAKDEETKGKIIPFLDGFLVEYSKKKLLLTENLEGILLTIKDFKIFTENKILGSILAVSDYVGATEEEFLQVHHEKWLKNMNERTKGEY